LRRPDGDDAPVTEDAAATIVATNMTGAAEAGPDPAPGRQDSRRVAGAQAQLLCDLDIMGADPHAGGYGVARQALHGLRLPATGVWRSASSWPDGEPGCPPLGVPVASATGQAG
jgi:hypothetical protein